MLSSLKSQSRAYDLLDKYGILLAGVLIFGYYLWSALDLFAHADVRRNFNGYFFQFSSVLLLWGLLYLGAKVLEIKRKQREENERNAAIAKEFERRKMQLEVLDDVSHLLNDTVNNPLAIISVSSASIREQFEPDSEVFAYLDRIDGALARVKEVLQNFKSYETSKIVNSIQKAGNRKTKSPEENGTSVDPAGRIQPG